jgi:hypothetical protein
MERVMNELPLFLIVLVPVILLLFVLAKTATNETDSDLRVSKLARSYYFSELTGKELGNMFTSAFKFLRKPFRKSGKP